MFKTQSAESFLKEMKQQFQSTEHQNVNIPVRFFLFVSQDIPNDILQFISTSGLLN